MVVKKDVVLITSFKAQTKIKLKHMEEKAEKVGKCEHWQSEL